MRRHSGSPRCWSRRERAGDPESAALEIRKGLAVCHGSAGLGLRNPNCPSARLSFTLCMPSNSAVAPSLIGVVTLTQVKLVLNVGL